MANSQNKTVVSEKPKSAQNGDEFRPLVRMPARFATINRLILKDLNKNPRGPTFYKHKRDDIVNYLKNPYANEKNLRDAVIYLYGASSHFRRLIQYFASLSDLSYVISPARMDVTSAKPDAVRRNFHKVANLLSSMDIKNQFENILVVCLREDIFYGTIIETSECVTVKQLPSDYCKISVVEDNVLNVSFDFMYFDVNTDLLELYPEEFRAKYRLYRNDMVHLRWQELDAPNSFAIKTNKEILDYAIPPFAGILREVFDLEDLMNNWVTYTVMCLENIPLNCWEVLIANSATA